jgi:hypothetical protein
MNIVTFNNHQLNKAIFIKKNINSNLEIFHKNFNKKHNTGNISNIQYVNNLINIIKLSDQSNVFLFFVLYFTREIWELLSVLNELGSQVVVIEETHNMMMHPYKIPGINLTPDLILAASAEEQKAIQQFYNFNDGIVLNSGWIFQSQYFDLINSSQEIIPALKAQIELSEKKILVYFAAPIYISANSIEDYESRMHLMDYLDREYPQSTFFIKPHPLEKIDKFSKMLDQKKINFIYIEESNLSKQNISNFDLVVSSAYSQCTIDNIIQDLPLLIYAFKEENFITKSFNFINATKHSLNSKNYLRVSEIYSGNFLSELQAFKDKNLSREDKSILLFKDYLFAKPLNLHDRSIELELMGYLLNKLNGLPILLSDDCPDRLTSIKILFSKPEDFNLQSIDFNNLTYPEKMYFSVIIWREILEGRVTNALQIEIFLREVFDSSFGLIFIRESIVFKYFLVLKKMVHLVDSDQRIFFDKVNLILIDRVIFGNTILKVLELFLTTKFNFFNKVSYKLLLMSSNIIKIK